MQINGDHLVSIAKTIFSSSLTKLGSLIAVAGVATLTGFAQNVAEAFVFWLTGVKLHLPPEWVGWVLLAIGIALAVYGSRHIAQRPVAANPHDVRNLAGLRALIHPDLLFFREHNFEFSFNRVRIQRLFEFVEEWRGAHKAFVDADVQSKLLPLRAQAMALAECIATLTYPVDRNPAWSTVDPGLGARDAERRAAEAARLINAAAAAYVEAIDDFDSTANSRIT